MFRFTIRDVLWLTLVVAVAVSLILGWKADRKRLTSGNKIMWTRDTVSGLNPGDEVRLRVNEDGSVFHSVIPAE